MRQPAGDRVHGHVHLHLRRQEPDRREEQALQDRHRDEDHVQARIHARQG